MRFLLSELRNIINEAATRAYEILGVPQTATLDDIKKAYRKKAIELHPDRNPGQDTATQMVMLNVAYNLLADPEKRRQYDLVGDRTLGDRGQTGATFRNQPTPTSRADREAEYERGRAEREAQYQRDHEAFTNSKNNEWMYFTKTLFSTSNTGGVYFFNIKRRNEVLVTQQGKIGGHIKNKRKAYYDSFTAFMIMKRMLDNINSAGYVRVENDPTKPPPAEPRAPRQPQEPGQQAQPATATTGSKTTYKVYGKKGQAPVHTRYKGKVYVGPADSRFKNGDQATVALGTDGRLSVNNSQTGHTQHWYAESHEYDDSILDEILNYIDDNE